MARQRNSGRSAGSSPPGRLRIVAGKWRNSRLKIAPLPGLRPTSERIRETLFNWLTSCIHGARCLDLYAGTGALGLEAMSRGAATVTFVEQSGKAAAMLRQACNDLGADGVTIRSIDALQFLDSSDNESFDLVFLDPPFADNSLADLCKILGDGGHLSPGALVYLEQPKAQEPPELPDRWVIAHEKTAGNVRYSLVNTLSQESPA
jgi:16S rRNA (guanine966-N2)-methyltransferase